MSLRAESRPGGLARLVESIRLAKTGEDLSILSRREGGNKSHITPESWTTLRLHYSIRSNKSLCLLKISNFRPIEYDPRRNRRQSQTSKREEVGPSTASSAAHFRVSSFEQQMRIMGCRARRTRYLVPCRVDSAHGGSDGL